MSKQVNKKKEKYFKLFEEGTIDSSLVAEKMNEVTDELKRLDARKLDEDNSFPVNFEMVRGALGNFKKLIDSSTDEQVKNLLRLVIKKITVNKEREFDSIKLIFNENVQEHFLKAKTKKSDAKKGPSTDEGPSSISNFYASTVIRFTATM